MAIESSYKKRLTVNSKDIFFPSLIRYSQKSRRLLSRIKDKDLIGFRCSDSFIRTNQGVYILEHAKTSQKDKRRIKNQAFIEFMRNKEKELPQGKKILTARICETQNKTILIFYSIGVYDTKVADTTPIVQTIFNSINNDALVQVIPYTFFLKSPTFTIDRSNGHLRCDEPFQITAKNLLYILCDDQQLKSANYLIYEIDLKRNTTKVLGRCENNFANELKTVCN